MDNILLIYALSIILKEISITIKNGGKTTIINAVKIIIKTQSNTYIITIKIRK